MKKTISPEDRIILDYLLTELSVRLNGAIDYWTIMCIGSFPFDRRLFIIEHAEIMNALVVVARAILARSSLASGEPMRSYLQTMSATCLDLQNAFLVLEQFRSVPLEEVRRATEIVAEVYTKLGEAVRQLCQDIDLHLSYFRDWTPEREKYFQEILSVLFEQFRHERESPQYLAAVPAATARSA